MSTDRKRGEITLLGTASDLFESWKWGDPAVTEEAVRETYIKAETDARDMDSRRGTTFGRNPIAIDRLVHLGIDPDTLQPKETDN